MLGVDGQVIGYGLAAFDHGRAVLANRQHQGGQPVQECRHVGGGKNRIEQVRQWSYTKRAAVVFGPGAAAPSRRLGISRVEWRAGYAV